MIFVPINSGFGTTFHVSGSYIYLLFCFIIVSNPHWREGFVRLSKTVIGPRVELDEP